MRIALSLFLLACSTAVAASASLRVGSHLLVAGDSATRVRALLGRPLHIGHRRAARGRGRGHPAAERWEYRRHGHALVVTLVDGVVTDIAQSLE